MRTDGEDQPTVLYLSPPGPRFIDPDEYFEAHIEGSRVAWMADCFPPATVLREAVQLCREHGRQLPDWLYDALDLHLRQAVADHDGQGGRHHRLGRLESDRRKHFLRWTYARTALAMRDHLPTFGYPASRAGVWQFVADQLRGTEAEAKTPRAVKASYDKVRRALGVG